jgi:hypothetical protein
MRTLGCLAALSVVLAAGPAGASSFFFSTGNPDGRMGALSRPSGAGVETETADDFVLTQATKITSATFTGLINNQTGGASVGNVAVEIYRVFPLDSNVGRTSGPPTFSTSQVPTRVNSPSDVALTSFDAAGGGLTFSTSGLSSSFTAANSVVNGINAKPGQTTGGEGPVTGAEELFTIDFTTPFVLPAGHYFFVPQVDVTGGEFLWLSAPRPIAPPGTPFPLGSTDLQAWIRNANLDPDWLRIGTDIIGGSPAPTFNMAFTLTGAGVPEPATWAVMLLGFGVVGAAFRRRARLRAA